jgi:hypothetical protein
VIARGPLLLVAAGCVAATALGLVFGQGRTVALAAALVLAAALAAATALQLRPARRQQPPPRSRDDELPLRLRQIADVLRDFGFDRSLPPLLAPIVAVRLGRRGVDMAVAPRQAQELLGDVLWEIVRPDRPPPAHGVGRGLADDELRAALERLEQL